MVEILPLKTKNEIKAFFEKIGVQFNENSGVTLAKFGEEELGYCAYSLDEEKITVLKIEPKDDLMMLDGILRSALHIADNRGITEAYFTDAAYFENFKRLDFIKNEQKKSLKIEKLHESCCCGEKNNN